MMIGSKKTTTVIKVEKQKVKEEMYIKYKQRR